MTRSGPPRSSARMTAAVAVTVLAVGAVLAACGGPSSSSTTTTTPAGSNTGADSLLNQLRALGSQASAASRSTFQATWAATSNATTTTVTLAQSPPKSKFSTSSGGVVLNDGTATYFCSSSATCLRETTVNPLSSLVGLYSGQAFLGITRSYSDQAALSAAGISLSFSNATHGGIASKCVTLTEAKTSAATTWCVSSSGILTHWSAGGSSFELTTYSSTVDANEFSLPAGATVVTIP